MSTATLERAPELDRMNLDVPVASSPSASQPSKLGARLVSLDAYRGFVMLLMASEGLGIYAVTRDNHLQGWWPTIAWHTQHVEWRGCSLWDLIQPSFTFMVGVAMPFSLAKRRSSGQGFEWMFFHALWRSLLLVALGIFLRSINKGQTNFTFEDTLTQIGLGYTFAFLLSWVKPRWQAVAVAVILVGYWLAFALYPLPKAGFDYKTVGVTPQWHAEHGLTGFAAHWDKNTNFAAAFDAKFLNLKFLPRPKPFDYNRGGYLTLSFIPTLATMLLGLLVGNLMKSPKVGPAKRVGILLLAGGAGIGAGWVLDHFGICPSVKRIWTPSWVLFSGGWCCLLLAFFYTVIDWAKLRMWAFPLVVVGMNSIAMYCLADGGFRTFVRDSLRIHRVNVLWGPDLFPTVARVLRIPYVPERWPRFAVYGPIVEWSVVLLILWLVLFWMYRRRLFIRI